jgi:hypothetical protein
MAQANSTVGTTYSGEFDDESEEIEKKPKLLI